ncbi:sigma-70 family RNA polymerase sigma factor [Saccharopolyspora taberi]|uniref:RNA polymerase sigma factor SigJ n=1 Tax=Saccharopolyspora taberi TaxID=60895 RepID=A0ABN3VMR4_9PSEU
MDDNAIRAEQFEAHRDHLRAVAYRMLGSASEADDAVQETWIRLSGADTEDVENLRGWLTTVVSRVCLNMLRSRTTRREEPLGEHVPEPPAHGADPADQAVLGDSVGLALLVVLDTLGPAERLAFVLHDLFAVPFDEIAPIVGRTPAATRQLASRARRRVQGASPPSEADLVHQREVVDAFLEASRGGDFEALLTVLDPDVVVRFESGVLRGAETVAKAASTFAKLAESTRPALVDGMVAAVAVSKGREISVAVFEVVGDRITAFDTYTGLEGLDLTFVD